MGHQVTGLLGSRGVLASFAALRSLHEPVPLPQGLAILPLRDDDIDSFLKPSLSGHVDGFRYLSEAFIVELTAASLAGPILYFETDYAGGTGMQGAAVFHDGAVVFGPSVAERGPINGALAWLGVRVVPPAADAFESVGLHHHRRTEDWFQSSE